MREYLMNSFWVFCNIISFAIACQEGSITPNPADCSTYLQCDHGESLIRPCPSGLLFSPQLSVCDWPANVNCGVGEITTPLAPTTTILPTFKTTSASKPQTSTRKPTPRPTTTILPPFTTTSASKPQTSTRKPTPRPTPIPTTSGPSFAPYIDVSLDKPTLSQVYAASGQKDFTLAFAIGSSEGCVPKWGGQVNLDDPSVLGPIRQIQAVGGRLIIATGGALGPYFETLCTSVPTLAAAYKKVLDTVQTTHLDIDIEATVNGDLVNQALAQVQKERPSTTVSYTLMVQAEDYGLTPALGVDILKNAKQNGVRVDFVNPMTMEFGGPSLDYGDSVINAAESVIGQMALIWPEKSQAQLYRMLSVTPMIGRNFNGKIFTLANAQKLVDWANKNKIGRLHFWSAGRDNGGCAGGGISPSCSSISQGDYQFTKIFQGFTG